MGINLSAAHLHTATTETASFFPFSNGEHYGRPRYAKAAKAGMIWRFATKGFYRNGADERT